MLPRGPEKRAALTPDCRAIASQVGGGEDTAYVALVPAGLDADLPALGAYGYRYAVPVTHGPAVFRARSAEAVPAAGGLWDDPEVTKRLWPPLTPALLRPLMPLSRGHLAQFGVSGLPRNTVLQAQDGTPYLVKGRAIKATNVRAYYAPPNSVSPPQTAVPRCPAAVPPRRLLRGV